ncbi:MAG TPA: hypothetical protein VGK74_11820 [Symbiobacteriaceae bacterium]|jgi:hypothetical protein
MAILSEKAARMVESRVTLQGIRPWRTVMNANVRPVVGLSTGIPVMAIPTFLGNTAPTVVPEKLTTPAAVREAIETITDQWLEAGPKDKERLTLLHVRLRDRLEELEESR